MSDDDDVGDVPLLRTFSFGLLTQCMGQGLAANSAAAFLTAKITWSLGEFEAVGQLAMLLLPASEPTPNPRDFCAG